MDKELAKHFEDFRQKLGTDVFDYADTKSIKSKIKSNTVKTLMKNARTAIKNGEYRVAEATYKKVVELEESNFEAFLALGNLYQDHLCNELEADFCFKEALFQNKDCIEAMLKMVKLRSKCLDSDLALSFLETVKLVEPDNKYYLYYTTFFEISRGRHNKAIDIAKQGLEQFPNDWRFQSILLHAYHIFTSDAYAKQLNELVNELIDNQSDSLALIPAFAYMKSRGQISVTERITPLLNKLTKQQDLEAEKLEMLCHYLPFSDATSFDTILEIVRQYADTQNNIAQFKHEATTESSPKKLRIGIVSSTLRNCTDSNYLLPVLAQLDRSVFEIYLYHNNPVEDEVTDNYKLIADKFCNIRKQYDIEAAQLIHADHVHILISFEHSMIRTRHKLFNLRPAPVQACYYFNQMTSGNSEIDFILGDKFTINPDNAKTFTEQPLYLDGSIFCFSGFKEIPAHQAPAHVTNEFITFGTLSAPAKLNRTTLELWAQIIKQVEGSKLYLSHPGYFCLDARKSVLKVLSENDVDSSRVIFEDDVLEDEKWLLNYYKIDIVLDTFGKSGTRSTCEALWMSKPVITYAGEFAHERTTASLIDKLGEFSEEVIAYSHEDYVKKAVRIGNNQGRIKELHLDVPISMKKSALNNPFLFSSQLSKALINAWNTKLPQALFTANLEDFNTAFMPTDLGVDIGVKEDIEDPFYYILKEQSQWFEPEHKLFCKLLKPGMNVLDIDNIKGMYSIPAAKITGDDGVVICTTDMGENAKLIQSSIDHNQLDNLSVQNHGDAYFIVEDIIQDKADDLDIIRLDATYYNPQFVEQNKDFWERSDAIIMFPVQASGRVDLGMAERFIEHGYTILTALPSLNCFIRFNPQDDVDPFTNYMFAVKPDLAEKFEKNEMLANVLDSFNFQDHLENVSWQALFDKYNFATEIIPEWEKSEKSQMWPQHELALCYLAISEDENLPIDERYTALHDSYHILLAALSQEPEYIKMLNLYFLLKRLNRMMAANAVLHELQTYLENCDISLLQEPFLPPCDEYLDVDTKGEVAAWLYASLLAESEAIRCYSSYFIKDDSLQTYVALENSGYMSENVKRRMTLIQERFPDSMAHVLANAEEQQPHAN